MLIQLISDHYLEVDRFFYIDITQTLMRAFLIKDTSLNLLEHFSCLYELSAGLQAQSRQKCDLLFVLKNVLKFFLLFFCHAFRSVCGSSLALKADKAAIH